MEIGTQNLDNLGLIAGMFDEIGVGTIIDRACGEQAKHKNLTFGECVKCMILNGLGFVGRTLYLYSEYFEDKPIDHLLGTSISPEQIDDNVLGRTLDKLFSLGVTELFTEIALQAMKVLDIKVKSLHLDSTSFHVDGNYDSLLCQGESSIKLTRGYSRDHRPELNQAILQVISSSQGNLPLFMKAASGNSSDKTDFAEIISEHIKSFQAAVGNRYFVGDSALYTPSSLKALTEAKALFVTRVPSQINKEKKLVSQCKVSDMSDLENGYYAKNFRVSYADIEQRWVVFFSEAAYQRECRTLLKHFSKGSEKELKAFNKLQKDIYSCPHDAEKAYKNLVSKFKYLSVNEFSLSEVKKYPTVGRPKKGAQACQLGYQVRGSAYSCLSRKKALEDQKGFFVLATNDLDEDQFSSQEVLSTYKAQQSVERGFRFLKSPDFLVSSFYLKKPERIEALLMVMTLCLLIYSAVEFKVRKSLKETGKYFLNQRKKPAQNPTSRWIFFCFLGLHLVRLDGKKHQVTNLKKRHSIILRCLGPPYERIYYSHMW